MGCGPSKNATPAAIPAPPPATTTAPPPAETDAPPSAATTAPPPAATPEATPATQAAAPKTLLGEQTFAAPEVKGGKEIQAATSALVLIEYQNEFTSPDGKLHDAVKGVMEANDMLGKSAAVAAAMRKAGGMVFHVPISFAEDGTDNPNKGLGILANCLKDGLFLADTPAAQICDEMAPQEGDVVVLGKKGLDAFPGTDLEAQLKANGIETVVLAGFLTNCCVESTMRTAYEKGFNVVTLTDCTATTSIEGQQAATDPEGTFSMFSTPMASEAFLRTLTPQPEAKRAPAAPLESIPPEELQLRDRSFPAKEAKGGAKIQPGTTAVLFIEYQNEFTTEGGKLHEGVKDVMKAALPDGMLQNSVNLATAVRDAGGKVFHAPISFATDGSDNPNKDLGILADCANKGLFAAGSWNAKFCDAMQPQAGDIVVEGKKGLDAFPGTDLEEKLRAHGIETLALAGFLTNCCVESTMRTACEKGFNVVTLTNCTATSERGQAAATEGTFGMFSLPMTAEDFVKKLQPEAASEEQAQGQTQEGVASSSTVVELEGPLQGKAAAADSVELEGPLQGKAAAADSGFWRCCA